MGVYILEESYALEKLINYYIKDIIKIIAYKERTHKV
jgi:hypothetical protein